MLHCPPVGCRLTIDGKDAEAIIAPYVGEHGIWLSNDAATARAHFRIALPPAAFAALLRSHQGRPFVIDVRDFPLGTVDENRGYAANDLGPVTRPITALKFGLRHAGGACTFRFEGEAGDIDPGSVFVGLDRPAAYRFTIEFDIPDDALGRYFVDAHVSDAVEGYVQVAQKPPDT